MVAERKTRKFTADEYQCMGQVGILGPDERVELLDGDVIIMSPIGPRHNAVVDRQTRLFVKRAGDGVQVRTRGSIRLSVRSEQQPDLVLLRAREDFYASQMAAPGDVLLIVEVADSSEARDRRKKIPLYARAGILQVWLEDLTKGRITVHQEPKNGKYQTVRIVGPGETLTPLALPDLRLRYEDIVG